MRLHPVGYLVILKSIVLVVVVLAVVNLFFPSQEWWHVLLYGTGLVFVVMVTRFFRWPERNLEADDHLIYSAADGSVVAIEETYEKDYFKDKRIQVSVFMSITNAHINWFPVAGKVLSIKHKPGKNYPAFVAKSSEENERNSIVVKTRTGEEIMIRQIAGIMARRIVCTVLEKEEITQGQEIGIIKFGSRVDLFLPPNVDVKVKLHQEVRGSRSIIAAFK